MGNPAFAGAYKKNKGNMYGEARRGKGQNRPNTSYLGVATKTPLEIAREEDALEEELGYHLPSEEGEEQLGWLVNASAVRFVRCVCFSFVLRSRISRALKFARDARGGFHVGKNSKKIERVGFLYARAHARERVAPPRQKHFRHPLLRSLSRTLLRR